MIYTTKEASKELRVTIDTIKRMIYRKELDAFKVGNRWRITEEEISRIKRGETK